MKSIYKKILSIGLLSAFFEFALAQPAHAEGLISGITSGVITLASQTILGTFIWIAQGFFIVSGFLIELAMKLNNNILDPAQNAFVFTGWTVFVNVADLALVVGLIIIAFATMLNFQSYGMKKTLPALIIVALLVNFSLVIPGVLVDLAGMVTTFFVNQAGLNGSSMSGALAAAFNMSGFMDVANANSTGNLGGEVAKMGTGIMSILLNMTFIIVFTAVATVVMLTLAAMLFLRYFMLSFLLLITPVIAVARIFPGTRSHWDKWWNDFVRWTMFPPVMVFFMWLSLTSLNATTTVDTASTGSAWQAAKNLMNFNISSLIHMAMAVMLMILSLVAANGISIKGAKGSKDMVATMTGWGRGKIEGMGKGTQAYGRREGERLGRRAGAVGIAGAGAIGRRLDRAGLVSTAAGLRAHEGEVGGIRGRISGIVGRAGEKVTTAQQTALKKTYDDKFKGISDDNLALRYSTMSNDEKVFAAQQLSAKGKLNKINEQILDRDLSDKDAKVMFDTYGGGKTYEKIAKAAGRNGEMVNAKKEINAANKLPAGVAKTDKVQQAKKKYEDESEKFYKTFENKDYSALAKEGFFDVKRLKEGEYNRDAMAAMLKNDPGQFASVTKNIGKGSDLNELMKETEKIRAEVKASIMEGIKSSLGAEDLAKLTSETNRELLEVMKELKASKDDIEAAKAYDNKTVLAWIEDRDVKAFKNIGGPSGITNLEDQMHLLHMRNNQTFEQMDEHTDYQRMARMQDSMRKSAAKRMSAGEEEKKEEKKP